VELFASTAFPKTKNKKAVGSVCSSTHGLFFSGSLDQFILAGGQTLPQ